MLGDWVTFADALKAGEFYPIKITSLTLPDIIAGYHPHPAIEGSDVYGEDDLAGIPLTPEILEKNGFIPAANGVSWYLRDDDTDECLLMLNEIHNAFVMSTAGMTIGFQYVHQLQHLLRLCGIKKKIEL